MTARTLLVLAAAASGLPQAAPGATIRVPADHPTLFEAVAASAPSDTILVAPGTYRDGRDVPDESGVDFVLARIPHPITILAEAGPDATTLELAPPPIGAASPTILDAVDVAGALVVEGFTLRGATLVSGMRSLRVRELAIRDCRFRVFAGGSGVALDVVPASDGADAVLEDCRFENCLAPFREGAVSVDGKFSLRRCEFRQCENPADLLGSGEILECTFEGNEGVALQVQAPFGEAVVMEECVFRHNVVTGDRAELVRATRTYIRRCFFLENAAYGYLVTPAIEVHEGECVHCYFRGNTSDFTSWPGIAAMYQSNFQWNVVVGNRTGGVGLSHPSNGGCNVLWDNMWGAVSPALGWKIDPQFCDPEARDVLVMSTSPLLAENSEGCGEYLLFAEGCETRGTIVTTTPPHVQVIADGVEGTAPLYREWEPGTLHVVEGRDTQPIVDGERYVFDEWSDGGARQHEVVAGPPGSLLTASHHREIRLATSAESGGSVAPPTGWYLPGAQVEITTIPDYPHVFDRWIGTGFGSYTGLDSTVVLTVEYPIWQVATFTRFWPVNVLSTDEGSRMLADGLEFGPPQTFHFRDASQHVVEVIDPVGVGPGHRVRFERWTDGNTSRVRGLNVHFGFSITAEFRHEYFLDVEVVGEGQVALGDSWVTADSTVQLVAVPATGWHFGEWIGEGDGSYSGPERIVEIALGGPVLQTAVFEPDPVPATAVVLSLSETDPGVAAGDAPLGLGQVHLWLECAGGLGASRFEGRISGGIPVLGFVPAPGVINTGSAQELALAVSGCPAGPRRLGTFLVQDLAGGGLCLEPTGAGVLETVDCSFPVPLVSTWPEFLRIRGVTTDGTTPCESGEGCGGGGRRPSGVQVLANDLRGARPNPVVGSAELVFALATPGEASLEVYDVTGRLVRRLARGPWVAGEHRVVWDRRDDRRQRVPAGVYFARLRTGGSAHTSKILVLD